jgi:hypothetical protein
LVGARSNAEGGHDATLDIEVELIDVKVGSKGVVELAERMGKAGGGNIFAVVSSCQRTSINMESASCEAKNGRIDSKNKHTLIPFVSLNLVPRPQPKGRRTSICIRFQVGLYLISFSTSMCI